MRYFYYCCLILFLICPTLSTSAQSRLSLTTTSTSSNTPAIGEQLSIFTKLKNVSLTDTFTGPIDFLLANQDSIIYDVNIVGKPAFAGTSITLAPQEERSALFTVELFPSHFKAGPDIIIVWPVAAVQITDSARAPIDIQPALGIADADPTRSIAYYSADHLFIRTNDLSISVNIYNMIGQCVDAYNISGPSGVLPMHHLPAGTYLADILTSGGEELRILIKR